MNHIRMNHYVLICTEHLYTVSCGAINIKEVIFPLKELTVWGGK